MHGHRHTRRGFIQSAAAASQLHASPAPPPFAPSGKPRRISETFVLEDTCNVYLVRDGSRGVLIDFGSGAILKSLGDTHHHPDQAQADALAAAERIPIAVAAHERHLFENVEDFWRTFWRTGLVVEQTRQGGCPSVGARRQHGRHQAGSARLRHLHRRPGTHLPRV